MSLSEGDDFKKLCLLYLPLHNKSKNPAPSLTPAEVLKVREVKTSQSFVPVSYYYANHMHGLSALTTVIFMTPQNTSVLQVMLIFKTVTND